MMKIETVNNKEIVISINHYKYIKKTKILFVSEMFRENGNI